MENLRDLLKEFYPFARKRFGFDKNAKIIFLEDEDNASNPLGKTAYYNPGDYTVSVYVTGRHPKDILRSVSHELVHHTQNCRGEFTNTENMGGQGYAQKDEHLREMEREAYEQGNLCFRDWEDMRKNNLDTNYVNEDGNMSNKDLRNNRLNSRIMEKWGFSSKKEETEEQVEENGGIGPLGNLSLGDLDGAPEYEDPDLAALEDPEFAGLFGDLKRDADEEGAYADAYADAEEAAGDEYDDDELPFQEGTKVHVIATENCGEEATVLEMLDDSTAKIQIGDEELVIRQDYLEKIKLDEANARGNVRDAIRYMFTNQKLLPALKKLEGVQEISQFLAFVMRKFGIKNFETLQSGTMKSYLEQAFATMDQDQDTTTNQDIKKKKNARLDIPERPNPYPPYGGRGAEFDPVAAEAYWHSKVEKILNKAEVGSVVSLELEDGSTKKATKKDSGNWSIEGIEGEEHKSSAIVDRVVDKKSEATNQDIKKNARLKLPQMPGEADFGPGGWEQAFVWWKGKVATTINDAETGAFVELKNGATATKQGDDVWKISGEFGSLKDGEVVKSTSVIKNVNADNLVLPKSGIGEEETVEETSTMAGGALEGAPMASKDDDEDEKLEESFSIKSAASNRNKLLSEQIMKAWFNK